jgi:hypothetical protein
VAHSTSDVALSATRGDAGVELGKCERIRSACRLTIEATINL